METRIFLPERLGRRMSFGPFLDPRDLLRFLLVASLGALPAGLWGAWAMVPLLALGAVLTLVRTQGESLWDHAARRLRYLTRRRRLPVAPPSLWGLSLILGGSEAGTVSSGGTTWWVFEHVPFPISGRDHEDLFRESLDTLRALPTNGPDTFLVREPVAWTIEPFLPLSLPASGSEHSARKDYARLLRQATRGKFRAKLVLFLPRCEAPTGASYAGSQPNVGDLERAGWTRSPGPCHGRGGPVA